MSDDVKKFMVEDARMIFRNFSGTKSQYNQNGERQFSVILDDKFAAELEKDGWLIKYLKPQEEGDEPTPYITVAVSFKNYPPRVVMLTSTSRTNLNEDSVEVLDWTNIQTCDLIARAYDWTVGDKSGTKAYLQSLFVTIEEDELERKYAINGPTE